MIKHLLLGLAAAGILNAQQNIHVTAMGSAAATMIYPLSIDKLADLDFGAAVSPTTASQVEISPDKWSTTGTRHLNIGDAQFVDGSFHQAIFLVKGVPGGTFQVSIVPDTTLSAGNNSMTVKWYQMNTQYLFPTTPEVKLTLGATLFIKAHQPKGNYSGDFNFTINYN